MGTDIVAQEPPAAPTLPNPDSPPLPHNSIFRRVAPGEKPPGPPRELKQWSSQTMSALLVGMIYGGHRGLVEARSPHGTLDRQPGEPAAFQNHRQRAAAYFVRGSILSGARVGSFVALLSAVTLAGDHYLAFEKRDTPEPAALAIGAGTACGLFGGSIGGWRSALTAGSFGIVSGGIAGIMHREFEAAVRKYGPSRDLPKESPGPFDNTVGDSESDGKQSLLEVVRWLEEAKRDRDNLLEASEVNGQDRNG